MRGVVFLVAIALLGAPAFAQDFKKKADKFTAESLVEQLESGHGLTGAGKVREHHPVAVAMLKDFEGWEPFPYLDSSDYCTVGYGRLIAKKHCKYLNPLPYKDGISEQQGEVLLQEDTRTARIGIAELVTADLDSKQFGALTNFVFNIGVENFRKSTMLRLINDEEYEAAAQQFGRWIRSGSEKPPGLVKRRACEAAMFRGEVELNTSGKFVRASCEGNGITESAGETIDISKGE